MSTPPPDQKTPPLMTNLYNALTSISRRFGIKSKQMSLEAFLTFSLQMNPNLTQSIIHDYLKCKREFGDTNLFCSVQDYLALTILVSYSLRDFNRRETMLKWESFMPFRLLEQTKFLSLFREQVYNKCAGMARDFVIESLFELDTSNSFDVQSQTVWMFRRVENKEKLNHFLEIELKPLTMEKKTQVLSLLRNIVGEQIHIDITGDLEDPKMRISSDKEEITSLNDLIREGLVERFNVDFEIEARITTNKPLSQLLSGQAVMDSDFEFSVDIFGSDLPLEIAHITSTYINFLLKTFYDADILSNSMSIFSEIKRSVLGTKAKRKFFNQFLTNQQTGITLPVHLFWMMCLGFAGHSKLDLVFQAIDALRNMNLVDGLISVQTHMLDVEMEFKLQEPGRGQEVLEILCRDYTLSSLLRGMEQSEEIRSSILENQADLSFSKVELQNFESVRLDVEDEELILNESNLDLRNQMVKDLMGVKDNLVQVLTEIKKIQEINEDEINDEGRTPNKLTQNKRKKLQSAILDLFFKLNKTFDKLFPEKNNPDSVKALSDAKIQSIKDEIIQELNEISSLLHQSQLEEHFLNRKQADSTPMYNTDSSRDPRNSANLLEGGKLGDFGKRKDDVKFGSFAAITNLKDPEIFFSKKFSKKSNAEEGKIGGVESNDPVREMVIDKGSIYSDAKGDVDYGSREDKKRVEVMSNSGLNNITEISKNNNNSTNSNALNKNKLDEENNNEIISNKKSLKSEKENDKNIQIKEKIETPEKKEPKRESNSFTDSKLKIPNEENTDFLNQATPTTPNNSPRPIDITPPVIPQTQNPTDPYIFNITKINKTYAEIIRPTKDSKKFNMMAKLAKFLKTKSQNNKVNEKANTSIRSINEENQSRSGEGSVYTVKTKKDGSKRFIANVRKEDDNISDRRSVDIVSRFEDLEQNSKKESGRSLYTKFYYGDSRNKKLNAERTEDVYGMKAQSIKEVPRYSRELSHEGKKETSPMRYSVGVFGMDRKRGSISKMGQGGEVIRSGDSVNGLDGGNNEIKVKSGDEYGLGDGGVHNGEKEVKALGNNGHVQRVNKASIETRNEDVELQRKISSSKIDESKEIIISNARNPYPLDYNKHVDRHVSLTLEPTLKTTPNQPNISKTTPKLNSDPNIPKFHKKDPSTPITQKPQTTTPTANKIKIIQAPLKTITIKAPKSQETFPKKKTLRNSHISAYSRDDGSVKSRIKKKILETSFERSPDRMKAVHIYSQDSTNKEDKEFSRKFQTGQDSKHVQSIYRQGQGLSQQNVNSVQERPKKETQAFVRSFTHAKGVASKFGRKAAEFDSANTFDNFDSYNLTNKSYKNHDHQHRPIEKIVKQSAPRRIVSQNYPQIVSNPNQPMHQVLHKPSNLEKPQSQHVSNKIIIQPQHILHSPPPSSSPNITNFEKKKQSPHPPLTKSPSPVHPVSYNKQPQIHVNAIKPTNFKNIPITNPQPNYKKSPQLPVTSNINEIRAKYKMQSSHPRTTPTQQAPKSSIDSIAQNLKYLKASPSPKPQTSKTLRKSIEVRKYHVNTLQNPKSSISKVKVTRDPFRKLINEYQDQFIQTFPNPPKHENSNLQRSIPEINRGSKLVKSIDLAQNPNLKQMPISIQSKRSVDLRNQDPMRNSKHRGSVQLKNYNRYDEVVNQLDVVNVAPKEKDIRRSYAHSKTSGVSNVSSNTYRMMRGKANTISENKELQIGVRENTQIKQIRYYPQVPGQTMGGTGNVTPQRKVVRMSSPNMRRSLSPVYDMKSSLKNNPYHVNPQKLQPVKDIRLSSTSGRKSVPIRSPSPLSTIDQISQNLKSSQKNIPKPIYNQYSQRKIVQSPQPQNKRIVTKVINSPARTVSPQMSQRNVPQYVVNQNREMTMKQKIISEMRKDDKIMERTIVTQNVKRTQQVIQGPVNQKVIQMKGYSPQNSGRFVSPNKSHFSKGNLKGS